MVRILSLGAKRIKFDRKGFIYNSTTNKPDFGSNVLWGSTLIQLPGGKITSDWKKFVFEINSHNKNHNYGISFRLNRNAKILEITSKDDYYNIMEKYKTTLEEDYKNKFYLDFVKISKEYDAFHLTKDAFMDLRMPLDHEFYELKYSDFYSYDCESWIIFNLNAINKGSVLTHNNIIALEEDNYDN